MKIDGRPYRTIWVAEDGASVDIIDQTKLPHELAIARLETLDDAASAIRDMLVRGAPLIGVAAAYGVCLALRRDSSEGVMEHAMRVLAGTRPTALNLGAALVRMRAGLAHLAPIERVRAAYRLAAELADEDVAQNRAIGEHGLAVFRKVAQAKADGGPLRVMTHCNAGWLATVDIGTALAPVYLAHDGGLSVHVWVSETRPRNQGASLTAWELGKHGVPHTVIADNAAGHLMQLGQVDLVVVGTDRTTAAGDVANKIGTYMKALAARDCGVPFYVAVPSSSIDFTLAEGRAIPIEERSAAEVTHIAGRAADQRTTVVQLVPDGTTAKNYGFDVTPARLITGLITERGLCEASASGLRELARASS